ncbi:MAG: sugar phosphate nucleotidyltransferase [Methanosarcinales archaeon]
MKALIPAAGIGTRLRPFTNAIPKELLPIGNKAVIEHVVEALKIAGITDIIIVVSPHKPIIIEYLGSGKRLGVHITYVVQDDPLGLANAVLAGKPLINTTFAVILGDNFFYPKTFIKELIGYHKEICADASIGAFEVEDVTIHGIILPKGNNVIDFIEKPRSEKAPSNIGDMGAYIFEPVIFACDTFSHATLPAKLVIER